MIVVNRNQSAIFGNIDGQKFKNVVFTKEAYDSLRSSADVANKAETKEAYDRQVVNFKNLADSLAGVEPEKKKEVKIGSGSLSIVHLNENKTVVVAEWGKPYLFNGKSYSRFYIPKEIYERIQESESKGIDPTPFYKFIIRYLRNKVGTQDKFNRVSQYISKTWVDKDQKREFEAKGYSEEEAKKLSTVYQVGITQEGILVTYKVSTLVGEGDRIVWDEENEEYVEDEEDCSECDQGDSEDDEEEEEAEIDLTLFVYQPKRNSKGHFYKKGSDEYVAEYNKQLEEFKLQNGGASVKTEVTKIVDNKPVIEVVEAVPKFAEDYLFLPAYQGTSGDAFYSGDELGHHIRVGRRHYLPKWDQVNTDDSTSARPGLHVGGLDYIQGYENKSTVVHNIFVDPQYIGAVVSVESGDGAMRVKEYFVHSSFIGPNKGLYHSSTYAAQTDEEWNKQLESALETVAQAEARIAEIKKKAAKAQELVDSSFVA